jgi:hypothetical protein
MVDTSNPPLSDGTTPVYSRSSAISPSKAIVRKMKTSELEYIIKDYDVRVFLYSLYHITDVIQTKSPGEVVAIVEEFCDAKKQLDRMI